MVQVGVSQCPQGVRLMIIELRFSLSCYADHFLAGALGIAVTSAFSGIPEPILAFSPATRGFFSIAIATGG
jgi:hypothetical protein